MDILDITNNDLKEISELKLKYILDLGILINNNQKFVLNYIKYLNKCNKSNKYLKYLIRDNSGVVSFCIINLKNKYKVVDAVEIEEIISYDKCFTFSTALFSYICKQVIKMGKSKIIVSFKSNDKNSFIVNAYGAKLLKQEKIKEYKEIILRNIYLIDNIESICDKSIIQLINERVKK